MSIETAIVHLPGSPDPVPQDVYPAADDATDIAYNAQVSNMLRVALEQQVAAGISEPRVVAVFPGMLIEDADVMTLDGEDLIVVAS